jgi:WD40 repeat protein
VTGVAFSPDNYCLASVGDDGAVKLWDLSTQQELCTLVEGLSKFTAVKIVGDELIAVGERNNWRGKWAGLQFWSTAHSPVESPSRPDPANLRVTAPAP